MKTKIKLSSPSQLGSPTSTSLPQGGVESVKVVPIKLSSGEPSVKVVPVATKKVTPKPQQKPDSDGCVGVVVGKATKVKATSRVVVEHIQNPGQVCENCKSEIGVGEFRLLEKFRGGVWVQVGHEVCPPKTTCKLVTKKAPKITGEDLDSASKRNLVKKSSTSLPQAKLVRVQVTFKNKALKPLEIDLPSYIEPSAIQGARWSDEHTKDAAYGTVWGLFNMGNQYAAYRGVNWNEFTLKILGLFPKKG